MPEPAVPVASNGERGDGAEIEVLICDDVDTLRLLLREVLGLRPGMLAVGEARDGNEAVDEARRLQPDVILLDLSMPHRTGMDALTEIREVAPRAKIIVLSGLVSPAIQREALALGASSYLAKGADPQTIVRAIEAAMSGGAAVPLTNGALGMS